MKELKKKKKNNYMLPTRDSLQLKDTENKRIEKFTCQR